MIIDKINFKSVKLVTQVTDKYSQLAIIKKKRCWL